MRRSNNLTSCNNTYAVSKIILGNRFNLDSRGWTKQRMRVQYRVSKPTLMIDDAIIKCNLNSFLKIHTIF